MQSKGESKETCESLISDQCMQPASHASHSTVNRYLVSLQRAMHMHVHSLTSEPPPYFLWRVACKTAPWNNVHKHSMHAGVLTGRMPQSDFWLFWDLFGAALARGRVKISIVGLAKPRRPRPSSPLKTKMSSFSHY